MATCIMVGREIPEAVCRREQEKEACRGCTASTRRCTKCDKQKVLVDAEEGLCAGCVPKERSRRGVSLPLVGTPSRGMLGEAMDNVIDRLRDISEVEAPTNVPLERPVGQPITSQLLEQAHAVLCEHATLEGVVYRIQAPLKVVGMRLKLLPDEAYATVVALQKKGKLVCERPGLFHLPFYTAPVVEGELDLAMSAAPKKRGRPAKNHDLGRTV